MTEALSSFGLHWWHSVRLEGARYLFGAAGVTLIYWLLRRWTAPRRIQTRQATMADRRREIRHSASTIVIFGLIGLIGFSLQKAGMIRLDRGSVVLGILLAQIVVMAVMHDAWFYWMHRSLHLRMLFRRAHATHHLSRTPTSWAAYAFAPIEAVTESIYIPFMLVVVSQVTPVYPLAVFLFLGHQIARNAIGHSGHELAWSGFTRSRWTGWLTTTTHHDLHHTEGRYNFGLYFTWWDRMMGTEHPKYHERFEAVAARKPAMPEAATA
jgi:sterol desaturase/sphingolipid hydroxylase (fatty acid hydroxylase superfamily)